MIFKETKSLFLKKYQYKVVLVTQTASLFRGGDFSHTLALLEKGDPHSVRVRSDHELTEGKLLCNTLSDFSDLELRVESPWISIYLNDEKYVNKLVKKFADNIKYVSKPANPGILTTDTVVMPKMDYDYRVTLAATKQEHSAFLQWAESNAKLKITKSCKRELLRNRSWGGTHFYITGDNNLLMAKMHLGGCIAKIQRIIKE